MEPISRAGLKLEAALQRFGLRERVRGTVAVDVGASTGGFTACLLSHGAARVVAVDVGHRQLHESLRGDPRVESAEGIDWKTLPLAELPGPFGFFTVDVSFVAARSMLRSLAFRLGDGADGVVLIKPQFELPDSLVRAGKVDDPNLRRLAVQRFTSKAEALGFEVLAIDDSPVPGGSGTVEILAHVRFRGRSQALPRPGERRPPKPARGKKRTATADQLNWFAVSAPGLEEVTAGELRSLTGAAEVTTVPGGVEFVGALEVGLRANLWLRSATRIVARLGAVGAREFGKLRRLLAGLPWESFVAPGTAIKVSATTSRCRLYHTGALAETVTAAIADRVKPKRPTPGPEPSPAEPLTILVRGVEDTFTISVDSSGERLHRRGWRLDAAVAPLRETLAAGLLALCEWEPSVPLIDPMCGAGTIPLEACAWALDRAPGLRRTFAFEAWPIFRGAGDAAGAATWQRLRAEAEAAVRSRLPAPIAASDRSADAVASARHNATLAGFAEHVQLSCADFGDVRPATTSGLVLMNPPYGRRLGQPHTMGRLYRDIGRVLRAHFRGWRAGLVVANRSAAEAVGLPVVAAHRLTNGGIPITLLRFDVQ